LQRQLIQPEVPPTAAKVEVPKAKLRQKPGVVKKKGSGKVADKKEVKAVIETKEPVKEPVKRRKKLLLEEKRVQKQRRPAEEAITTSIKKLSGTKLTGRLLICLSLINRKKKKRFYYSHKPGSAGAAGAANKNKRKRIAPKPSTPRPPGVPGAPNPNKITPNVGGGGFNANRSSRLDS
jgi:translation initiation factor IF-2